MHTSTHMHGHVHDVPRGAMRGEEAAGGGQAQGAALACHAARGARGGHVVCGTVPHRRRARHVTCHAPYRGGGGVSGLHWEGAFLFFWKEVCLPESPMMNEYLRILLIMNYETSRVFV